MFYAGTSVGIIKILSSAGRIVVAVRLLVAVVFWGESVMAHYTAFWLHDPGVSFDFWCGV